MNDILTPTAPRAEARPRDSWSDRLARNAVHRALSNLRVGEIRLTEGNSSLVFRGADETPASGAASASAPELRAEVRVHDPAFYRDVLFGGSLGAGESYMEGRWSSDDLAGVVRIAARNRAMLDSMDGGLARLLAPFARMAHLLRRNTRAGSRRNIAAHYDLGNDFYRLFLDETMTYSCGVFEREDSDLREASIAKIDRACRKLDLRPGDRLLEIGTGWGALAIHAAREYGCHVTTTTISRRQHEVARERIDAAGLGDRITLLLEDYRDLTGRFDKLVSIEMIEAVGWEFLGDYFAKCSDLLEPHGSMLVQGITIDDRRFDAYRKSVDFINRHVFPGGCLVSPTAVLETLKRRTDMRLFHMEEMGPHYARTLREWRRRFEANLPAVRALGLDDRFIRMWDYYLQSCEGGFEERVIGVNQMLLVKPGNRRSPIVPRLA